MDLVLSDLHADINALDEIIGVVTSTKFRKKHGELSRIFNLGDVLERGTHPKQVLEKLKLLQKNFPINSVMGNHDEAYLYGRKVSGSSIESIDAHLKLSSEDLEFFTKNKDETYGQQQLIDKKEGLICVHGGPLDAKKITPKDAGPEGWLYQKSWQRLSEEDFEYFSYSGYHYKATSAFEEGKNFLKNFVILCGHQHMEAVLQQNENNIEEILSLKKPKVEKLSKTVLEKKEIEISPNCNYFIRLGLGGPEGYYGVGDANPQFAIIEYNPKKVTLFKIISR